MGVSMKLIFENNGTKLYEGSATKLDKIEDKSVDLILADPPYGMKYVSGHRFEKFDPIAADKAYPWVLMKDTLWEAHRVMKNEATLYFFTTWSVFHKLFPQIQEFFILGTPIIWCKNNWSAGNLKAEWANRTEIIIHAYKKGFKLRGSRPANVLFIKRIDGQKLKSPTEKPVPLLEYIISKSSDKDDTVLDMFMGSGSTIEAAINLGRKAIGVDLSEAECEKAKLRLTNLPVFAFPDTEVINANFELPGLSEVFKEPQK